MRRILKEPLLHFLLLGICLFAAARVLSKPAPQATPRHIVVSEGQVEHLINGFTSQRQRPPTPAELKGLIDDWVREEIAVREAMALGLDRGDAVVRRQDRKSVV